MFLRRKGIRTDPDISTCKTPAAAFQLLTSKDFDSAPRAHYACAVDSTMLVTLSAIASQQAKPTVETMRKTLKFLDYVSTHPDAILTFSASNIVLNVHSDASHLIEPKARSRAGGHFSCLAPRTTRRTMEPC